MAQRILNYDLGRADQTPQALPPEAWAPRASSGGDQTWQFISLRELWSRVYRRRLLIGLFVFIATALAYKVASDLTPLYQSSTRLILETQNAAVLGLEQTLGFGSLDERHIQSKLQEIRSSNFLGKIADDHGLLEIEEFNPVPKPPPFWKRALIDVGVLAGPSDVDEFTLQKTRKAKMISRLQDKVSVGVVGVSHVIEIGVKSENPDLAASLANTIAQAYIVTRLESRYEAAEQTASWFAEKVAALKSDVQAADNAIANYRAENGLVETNQGDQIGQQIGELTSQLVLAETERATRENQLRRIQSLRGNPEQLETAIGTAGNPLIQRIRDEILTKRTEVQQLSAEFGSNHPQMIAAQNELGDLEQALAGEIERLVQDARDNLAIAQAQEDKLREILQQRQSDATENNHARVTLATMERDANAKRSLLESFLSRRTEVTAQEDFLAEKPEARVIASAEPGNKPVYPPKNLILIGAFMGSLVIGSLIAILAAELDSTYRSADQLEQKFPTLRVIGTIPTFGRGERSHKRVALAVVKSPGTAYAESIRSLAGRLASRVQADPSDNTFIFTSAEPAEGKTSTIASTARQLALIDKKVVLIDCDLRRSTLHKAFAMPETLGGLVPYLKNEVGLDRLPVADEVTPLDLIFTGGNVRDVYPLINSERMVTLITELKQRYDIIMIDSPPVMAVDDVQYLRRYATMMMFCVRWGQTRQRTVDRALQTMVDGDSSQPIGLVLSLMDAVEHSSYDYSDAGLYTGKNARYYSN